MKEELFLLINFYRAVAISLSLIERQSWLLWLNQQLAPSLNCPVYLWNLASKGFSQIQSEESLELSGSLSFESESNDPQTQTCAALDFCHNYDQPGIFVLENIPSLLSQERFGQTERLKAWLINTVTHLSVSDNKYLILLDTNEIELPPRLGGIIPSFIVPLPTKAEVKEILAQMLSENLNDESDVLAAVSGLSKEEIKIGIKLTQRRQEDNFVAALLDYKINRLRGLGLELIPKPQIINFGGLDRLQKALEGVKIDFSAEAREYNIPLPKGWLFVGPPGTGKTLAAKVCARQLGFPLISVGIDVVKAGGAALLKKLLLRLEASAPAVCYFDEFDKFFSANSTTGENNQTQQVLGVLLSWLQEKKSETFVIGTLNRLDALPPELTRAGRFDQIFYVGFPQAGERKQIFQLYAANFDPRYRKDDTPLTERQWRILLNQTHNCTGAEIKRIVESAARKLFQAQLPLLLELDHFLEERKNITPLYMRDTDRILAMENRARHVCEPASSPDQSQFAPNPTSLWGEIQEESG